MSQSELERRYRGLLAAYPWEHRRVYEEEMLAVLLAGATAGQRRPSLADVWNLLAGALRVRLNTTGRGPTRAAWVDAAAVMGLLATLTLLALSWQAVARYANFASPPGFGQLEWVDRARLAGWGLVAAAIALGWRWPAAGLAWVVVIGEATWLTSSYGDDPVSAVNMLWRFALTIVAAATLTVAAPRRRAVTLLGGRRLAAIMLAVAVFMAVYLSAWLVNRAFYDREALNVAYATYTFDSLGLEAPSEPLMLLFLAGIAAAGLTVLVTVVSLPGPVRWRIAALVAPIVSLLVLVDLTLSGWADSNNYLDHAIYLVPAQWVALVGVPLVTLAIGVLAVQRRDHIHAMVEIGRSVDRQRLGPDRDA